MKYYIAEIQQHSDDVFAHLMHNADNRNEAESKYYQVLAAAAISNLPKHSAILFTDEGFPLMHHSYSHTPASPVIEEETTEEVVEEST